MKEKVSIADVREENEEPIKIKDIQKIVILSVASEKLYESDCEIKSGIRSSEWNLGIVAFIR